MAFMTHDEYLKTFGSALGAKASTPGIAPGAGQPPQLAPAFQATQAPAPAAAYPGVSEQAVPAMGPPRPSAGPLQHKPLQEAAFGAPAPAAPAPAGPAFTPPAAPEGEGEKPKGKTTRDYLAEATPEQGEKFADQVQKDMGVEDLDAAATQIALKDPALAAQYKTGAPDKKWDRAEAAAFLLEFGLRMMQSSGSGTGNFASAVGDSALGAFEARREAKLAEEAKADRARQRGMEDTKFGWEKEDRPGEVAETAAERRRREAAEMRAQTAEQRAQEAHDKNQKKGDWVKSINDKEEIVFQDPNTGKTWNTGVKATSRDADGRASAFREKMDAWRQTAAGLNNTTWDKLSPNQQALIDDAYFKYERTGVNSKAVRDKFIGDYVMAAVDPKVLGPSGRNPEVKAKAEAAALEAATKMANDIYGAAEQAPGGMPLFGKTPPPGATPEQIADFYLQNPEG